MKNSEKQLVALLDDFELHSHFSPLDQQLHFHKKGTIPFLRYPNNKPCFEANSYMAAKFASGLSKKIKGGTLKTYAFKISHLIRYCYKNKLLFRDITDDRFSLFINFLQAEKNQNGEPAREIERVIQIGRQCIDFLVYLQELNDLDNFIGQGKQFRIKIKVKKYKVYVEGNKKPLEKEYFHHNSFPTPDPVRKRHPVSKDALNKIKQFVMKTSDRGLRRRNLAIIQTFEQTGTRRTEALLTTVDNVRDAINSSEACPRLKFVTLKRSSHERLIPVPRVYLENLMDYINTTRRSVVYKKLGKKNDHGFVFVSHTSGKPLSSDTISTYMGNWRRSAGIEDEFFAHLIRHYFITEKLKCMILEYDYLNRKDEFRKALLTVEKLKIELQQWSGHRRLHSLDTYIDLAYDDISGYKKSLDKVSLMASVDAIIDKLDLYLSEVDGDSKKAIKLSEELKEHVILFKDDVDNLI